MATAAIAAASTVVRLLPRWGETGSFLHSCFSRWRSPPEGVDTVGPSMSRTLNSEPFSPTSPLWLLLLSWHLCSRVLLALLWYWALVRGPAPGLTEELDYEFFPPRRVSGCFLKIDSPAPQSSAYPGDYLPLPYQIKFLLHLFPGAGIIICITKRGRWGDPCPNDADWDAAGSFSQKNRNITKTKKP